ncbi:MAG TPA: M15 family metallopeptidase [Pseudomonadales bacterium]
MYNLNKINAPYGENGLTRSVNENGSGLWPRANLFGRFLLGATIVFVVGCDERSNANENAEKTQSPHSSGFFAYDPLPADMGLWECDQYLTAIRGTSHETTLRELLKVRPHAYWEPAPRSALVEVPDELIAPDRRNHPVYLHLMEPQALAALQNMVNAASVESITLRVQSAYRSSSYQNALWKTSLRDFQFDLFRASFLTAPPCFSEHATGRAVDFDRLDEETFEESPMYQWLHANAAKWGWVQSFRDDNGAARSSEGTGIMVEPWHFHHSSMSEDEQPHAF